MARLKLASSTDKDYRTAFDGACAERRNIRRTFEEQHKAARTDREQQQAEELFLSGMARTLQHVNRILDAYNLWRVAQ
jgi:hypothetical protein